MIVAADLHVLQAELETARLTLVGCQRELALAKSRLAEAEAAYAAALAASEAAA